MTILHAAADTTYAYVDTEGTMHEMLAWMAPADRLAIDIDQRTHTTLWLNFRA